MFLSRSVAIIQRLAYCPYLFLGENSTMSLMAGIHIKNGDRKTLAHTKTKSQTNLFKDLLVSPRVTEQADGWFQVLPLIRDRVVETPV